MFGLLLFRFKKSTFLECGKSTNDLEYRGDGVPLLSKRENVLSKSSDDLDDRDVPWLRDIIFSSSGCKSFFYKYLINN